MQSEQMIEQLKESADEASRLLRVLGNPDRLLILCQLTTAELCVSDIESVTGIRQPTLSQQLTVLREEKLVETRREGKHIFYKTCPGPAHDILEILYKNFCAESCQTV